MLRLLKVILPISIILLLSQSTSLLAQGDDEPGDPVAVLRATYNAINSGDLEGALAAINESSVKIALPPPPGTSGHFIGLEGYTGLNGYLIGNNAHFSFIDLESKGNTIYFRAHLVEDLFRMAGTYPIEFSGSAVVSDGMIVSETWIMDPQDAAMLGAAITEMNNKASLLSAYEEVFNGRNLESLDQAIASDAVDHAFPDLRGVDAFRLPIMGLLEAFPDLHVEADMIVAEDDLVMAVATFTGTHEGEFLGVPPSGEQVTWTAVDINRFVDGLVVEAWHIGVPGVILDAISTPSQ